MNRQLLVVLALVAAAGLAGAYMSGVFDPAPEPAAPVVEAPEPAAPVTTAITPAAPAATPRAETPRPAAPRPPAEPPPPAAPTVLTTATLRIDSDVPGAQVFVDNKFVGTAPATVEDVAPGQRKINVQAPGWESVAEFHDITPGARDIVISLKTIRLDQRVEVRHRHGIGSCSGTLIATPNGLRYETTHKEDAFSVALTAIETFEVDFLKNNLKVKIRGGKTYDFSDPSGKADALYLFHQEVDKVRRRLAGGVTP